MINCYKSFQIDSLSICYQKTELESERGQITTYKLAISLYYEPPENMENEKIRN